MKTEKEWQPEEGSRQRPIEEWLKLFPNSTATDDSDVYRIFKNTRPKPKRKKYMK